MSPPPESLAVVVLAGGRSQRMGSDKAHLAHPKSGLPLLLHQLETIAVLTDLPRMVSARRGQVLPSLPPGVIRIDDDGSAGPLGGIIAALTRGTDNHLMMVPVDLPYLTTAVLQRLATHCPLPDRGVYAQSPTGPEPLVSIVPASLRHELESALDRGDLSLRQLFAEPLAHVMTPVCFDMPEPFQNWNHPHDI